MNELKPLCSVFVKEETMEQENSLEHVIKMEVVDLEPDYIECNTHAHMELNDADNCDIKVEVNGDKQTVPIVDYVEDIKDDETKHEVPQHDSGDSQLHQEIVKTEFQTEIDANDEACGSELSKLHESEADTVVQKRDTEHVNNLHISDICSGTCSDVNNLLTERATFTYSCNECSYKCVKQSTIIRHYMKTHGRKVSCDLCNYRNESENNIASHMLPNTDEKQFSCLCDFKCTQDPLSPYNGPLLGGNEPLSPYNGPLRWTVHITYGNKMIKKETTTQRKRRLEKNKLKRREKLANETKEQKQQRLGKRKLAVAKYREKESLDERSRRQYVNRIRAHERRKNESREQHLARLERNRMLKQGRQRKTQ